MFKCSISLDGILPSDVSDDADDTTVSTTHARVTLPRRTHESDSVVARHDAVVRRVAHDNAVCARDDTRHTDSEL